MPRSTGRTVEARGDHPGPTPGTSNCPDGRFAKIGSSATVSVSPPAADRPGAKPTFWLVRSRQVEGEVPTDEEEDLT
jgi:hypothetical protein